MEAITMKDIKEPLTVPERLETAANCSKCS